MNEHSPHSTPEKTSFKLPHVPEGLQADVLDDLVGYKSEIRAKYGQQPEGTDYTRFESEFIDALLHENGIRVDAEDQKSVENYAFAKDIYTQVVAMGKTSGKTWDGTPEGENITRRAQFMNDIAERYQSQAETDHKSDEQSSVDNATDTSGHDEAELTDEQRTQRDALREKPEHNQPGKDVAAEIEAVDSYFNEIRETYANILATRSKELGVLKGKYSAEDIEKAKETYADLVRACATELMLNMEQDGKPKDAIIETIDAFISEEVDYFIADLETNRAADFAGRSKLVRAGLEKWASWGPRDGANLKERFFSKGNVKKGAVYAGLGVTVGAVAAPLIGFVGGSAAVIGGSAYLSKKIARNLVGARLDAAAKSETIAKLQADDLRGAVKDGDEKLQSGDITNDILNLAQERSDEYRKRNRRRFIGGTAISLVAGGSVAGLIAAASEVGFFGAVGDKVGEIKGNYFPGDTDVKGDINTSIDGPSDVTPGTEFGSDGGDGGNGGTGNGPELTARDSMFNGQFAGRELSPAGQEALEKQFDGYTVKPGDTVWDLSEKFLNEQGIQNPTVYEIDATKDAMLSELRATNSVDSRGWLTVGDKIRIK